MRAPGPHTPLAALVILLAHAFAWAQTPPPGAATEPGRGEVEIALEQFGLGNHVRPGSWAGIRLALTDLADRPRSVAVRLHLLDGDGDRVLVQRSVTLTPQRALGVWLYARLPWDLPPVFDVSVHEATPLEGGRVRVGRQVARTRISPRDVVDPRHPMLAVVGDNAPGLQQYQQTAAGEDYALGSHAITRIVEGIRPEPDVLPDDWRGWAAFDAVVWTDPEPAAMGGDAPARALREWINRGGHLVVLLPPIGGSWTSPANPLADLLPTAEIERVEDADLAAYRWLLSRPVSAARAALPSGVPISVFRVPPGTPTAEATPLFAGPHGVVACRRLVGVGMATFIGLDLASPRLRDPTALRADALWNRVLGRRVDIVSGRLSPAEEQNARTNRRLALEHQIDRIVGESIDRSTARSVGVLLALTVFVVYWLAAGPVGFGLLKRLGVERHAWVGFVATTAVFAGIAWGGAGALRPREVSVQHLTLLNHVYGQPLQHARMWGGVLLPEYGEQTIRVGREQGRNERDSIFPWESPDALGGDAFPDARAYVADVRSPETLTVPARSTVKQFEFDWAGGQAWSTPVPVGPDAHPRLENGAPRGRLVHDLPAALRDVKIILVEQQLGQAAWTDPTARTVVGRPPSKGSAWALGEPWDPGETLDLASLPTGGRAARFEEMLRALVPRMQRSAIVLPGTDADLERIGLLPMLPPPDYRRGFDATRKEPIVVSRATHGLDIARWFTQPTLIITGRVDDAPTPVPLSVDGRDARSSGTTVLRWVYPLAPDPPRFHAGAI